MIFEQARNSSLWLKITRIRSHLLKMLLGGVPSYQASATERFSESKTALACGLARTARTKRAYDVKHDCRPRGGLERGFLKSVRQQGIPTSGKICARAGLELSKKEAAMRKQTQKKSKNVNYENAMISRKRSNDIVMGNKSHKQVGKDFSVLAELLSQQDSNSASLVGRQSLKPNQPASSVRTMEDVLNTVSSSREIDDGVNSESNELLSKRFSSRKDARRLQSRQVGGSKFLVQNVNQRKAPAGQSIDSPVAQGRSKESNFRKTVRSEDTAERSREELISQVSPSTSIQNSAETSLAFPNKESNSRKKVRSADTTERSREEIISQVSPSTSIQSSAEASLAFRNPSAEGLPKVEEDAIADKAEKRSLRGHDILQAMQKAAMEKARQKQRNRAVSERAVKGKENTSSQETFEWRNARPIVIRPEWALQIESLEGRIQDLKDQMQIL